MKDELRGQLLALATAHVNADRAFAALEPAERASPAVHGRLRGRAHAEGMAVTAIVEQEGWPSVAAVGPDGQRAFLAVLAAAASEEPVLVRCRDEMRTAVREGAAEHWQVAVVEDRLAVAQGREPRYGTIGDGTVADADGVDARRSTVGLPPLAEQRQALERDTARRAANARPGRPAWRSWLLMGLGVASLAFGVALAARADDGSAAGAPPETRAGSRPAADESTVTTEKPAAFVIGRDTLCDLFSQAEAQALLGVELESQTRNTPFSCQYAVPDGQGSISLSLTPAEAGAAQQFAFGADGTTPIDGLGQDAYFSQDLGGPILGILTDEGDTLLLSPRGAGIPPDLQEPMTSFMRSILPRLA